MVLLIPSPVGWSSTESSAVPVLACRSSPKTPDTTTHLK